MSSGLMKFRDSQDTLGADPTAYYSELTLRNRGFIAPVTQARLSRFHILIAGCGSTGGACIESLARLGVQHFTLADNGAYELNNLNRQHVRMENLGENKAALHRREVLSINPSAEVRIDERGVTRGNVEALVADCDLVFDAVDVTGREALEMKYVLHEVSHARQRPVLSALDLGFRQFGFAFDYRDPRLPVLDGRLAEARAARHPLKSLFKIFPLSSVPVHCLEHVSDLLANPEMPASQLGCASDLLSAIIVPVVIRYVETGELPWGWNLDLESMAFSWARRVELRLRAIPLRRKIARQLRELP